MYDLYVKYVGLVWFGFMVFNATFNNISVISWWSILLVEETGVPWRPLKYIEMPISCIAFEIKYYYLYSNFMINSIFIMVVAIFANKICLMVYRLFDIQGITQILY